MMKNISATCMAAICTFAFTGCSREQSIETLSLAGKTYNESAKNNAIKNWRAKVADTPNCHQFAERFRVVGERYDSAANGSFQMDMIKLWDEVKQAGCVAPV